ncbi:MAG: DMT family transporter [Alphaproteobacteria bacterium]|nr:DMT family transporter [Alphaproteobacteria bacterium]MCB9929105.1 DMT family transporter [Alphaproteobacteria bacterium]
MTAASSASTPSASAQMKGILFIVVSNGIFGLTDALSKVLTGSYPPGEILFFRSVFVFVSIAVMVMAQGGWRRVQIVNWRLQWARGLLLAATSYIFVVVLKHLPLADLTAMMFISPLVLTALAPRFLGERVGWRRWTAVGIGFGGALLIIRPSGEGALWPMLLAATMPLTMSIRDIITRRLAVTDTATGMMICSTLCVMAGGLASLPFGWAIPTWEGLGLFALTGTLQGVAQFFLVYAFIYGEAVVVAPFRYFLLLWATLYGWLFFGAFPRAETITGAAIVCAAGLYIFYREMRHGRG